MSLWSQIFGSEPWREFERRAKKSRKVALADLTALAGVLFDDLLEAAIQIFLAEQQRRELEKRGSK